MREQQIILAFAQHDKALNDLNAKLHAVQKGADRAYHFALTHVMMWDALMTLLNQKGMVTKIEFEETLKELSEKTRLAMEAEEKKKANGKTVMPDPVIVTGDKPVIPVLH